MSTALTKYTPLPATVVDCEVSAETPVEMKAAQINLITWCECKIAAMVQEHGELAAATAHAIGRKWSAKTLKRHTAIAEKRVQFYQKIKAALEAGYVIVPNFPVAIFAVRTEKDKPVKLVSTSQWDRFEQKAETLPIGAGEYQNPLPVIYESGEYFVKKEGQPDKKMHDYWAERWADFEFPVNMSRVKVMEASSRAMALKLFDDLGVLPDSRRTPDPVIFGRLLDPRSTRYHQRIVSFMIAWHLDTRTL